MITDVEGMLLLYVRKVGPISSYDLLTYLRRTPFQALSGGESTVYPRIKRLADKGFITPTAPSPSDGAPPVWHITEAGRDALFRWSSVPLDVREYRNNHTVFEVKCIVSRYLDPPARADFLEGQLAVLEAYMRRFKEFLRTRTDEDMRIVLANVGSQIEMDIKMLRKLRSGT